VFHAFNGPNSPTPDQFQFASYCNNQPQKNLPCIQASEVQLAARSRHPGGVNACNCDGSTRFVSNDIDIAVWRAVDAILQGYAGPVSVEELASRAGLGVRQLERRFKAVVGVSPKQHVIAVRLAAAQAMLLETPATVAEVAAATGFASAAHLTAAFTRRVGAPPAAWRAAAGRGPGA
jgi:AraC-like DNA-binding protein